MSSYFWSGIHCVLNILLLVIKLEIRFLSFSEDRKKKLNTQIFFKTLLSWHKYNCGKGAAFAQQKAVGRSLCYCLIEKSFPASHWKRMWVNIKNSTPLLCQEHVHLLVQPMKGLFWFFFLFVCSLASGSTEFLHNVAKILFVSRMLLYFLSLRYPVVCGHTMSAQLPHPAGGVVPLGQVGFY